MRRGWKILIGAVVAVVVLLGLNAIVTDKETKPAEVTVEGGEIMKLPGGDLQVVDSGPAGPENPRPGREGTIVLIHCFTCAIDWWDGMRPLLEGDHRVVAVDLLGHGGSEKPDSSYTIPSQADLVAQALARLDVRGATVVGHSLGGSVAVALAQRSPQLVDRVAIIDTRSSAADEGDLGLLAGLAFSPVIGEFLWRIKPDFSVKQGLEVAFAPGFDVPDAFVEDVKRMTFSSYDDSPTSFDDFTAEETLAERAAATKKPLLVIMGAEEQIIDDPRAALASYREDAPAAQTELVTGAGHSPNVERPELTAGLILTFAAAGSKASSQAKSKGKMHKDLQKREDVRQRP